MAEKKTETSQHEEIPVSGVPAEKLNVDPVHLEHRHPLRRDKAGLPLVPQPTVHKDDPLVR